VNGAPVATSFAPGSYAEILRAWQTGDVVRLDLPMRARRVKSHPYALENAGRVALMRGPLLYCVEGVDHPGCDLRDLALPSAAELEIMERSELLGGVVILCAGGESRPPDGGWDDQLYRTASYAALGTHGGDTRHADDAVTANYADGLHSVPRSPQSPYPILGPGGTTATGRTRPVEITAIPYYAWANREAGQMQVWLRDD